MSDANATKIIKIIIFAALSVLFVFDLAALAVPAENITAAPGGVTVHINTDELDGPPDITAAAAVLMDAATGELIYEKNSSRLIYPASTVKIMTAIIVLENVEDLQSTVVVSRFVVQNAIGNTMDPRASEGEIFTVEDLLSALLLRGANDAALALAEHVGGSVTAFVDKMNAKAKELGCEHTVFTNPTGMHSSEMRTTASDMAKIAFYASKTQKYMDISTLLRYEIPATNRTRDMRVMHNRNHFVSRGQFAQYYYEHAKSINFGSTTEAGLCLAAIAEQTELAYLCLVMGSTSSPIPETDAVRLNCFPDARSLFEWVFSMYSYRTAISEKDIIISAAVKLSSNRDVVTLIPDAEITILLHKNADIDEVIIKQIDIFEDMFVAPIEKGDILGRITVIYNGEAIGTANLRSTADFELSDVLYVLEWVTEMVSGVWFRASVIIFFVIFAFYISVTLLRRSRAAQRRF